MIERRWLAMIAHKTHSAPSHTLIARIYGASDSAVQLAADAIANTDGVG